LGHVVLDPVRLWVLLVASNRTGDPGSGAAGARCGAAADGVSVGKVAAGGALVQQLRGPRGRALRLSDSESDHLYLVAGVAPPSTAVGSQHITAHR
jgi:hypothetical protein